MHTLGIGTVADPPALTNAWGHSNGPPEESGGPPACLWRREGSPEPGYSPPVGGECLGQEVAAAAVFEAVSAAFLAVVCADLAVDCAPLAAVFFVAVALLAVVLAGVFLATGCLVADFFTGRLLFFGLSAAILAFSRRTSEDLFGALRTVLTALTPSLRMAATIFSPRSTRSA